ncbi:MAG: HAD hydrolase-like protein [archaeon]
MPEVDLAVFDWNGCMLADTQPCYEADCHAILEFGGTPPDMNEYRKTVIIPANDFYVLYGCNREELEANKERLGKVFHDFYEPRAGKCRTRKGLRETLEHLRNNKIDSIILSNHTIPGINTQLERLNLQGYISEVLANDLLYGSMEGRSKLGRLKQFYERNKGIYSPDRSVIIGDSPEEIEIGKELGMLTVAIEGGYYDEKRLVAAEPHHQIRRISCLINLV